ncbi:element excision factor XisH family protein [Moorena sp. SIO4E2]|uniref:element excision factor XisH family protein n=1 Tax=Moorena sp. SIO4E2 TaxID=2607826 RepID=UPI00257FFFFA|nr:element excision factor XisH family protein [Moorena sp. SIO4E2]
MTAFDEESKTEIPLFNPRIDDWQEHFIWSKDTLYILGITSKGRATVLTLDLNRKRIINIRAADKEVGRHPPENDPIQSSTLWVASFYFPDPESMVSSIDCRRRMLGFVPQPNLKDHAIALVSRVIAFWYSSVNLERVRIKEVCATIKPMPAKDIYHHAVRFALVKDGWKILTEDYTLEYGGDRLYVDIAAEKSIAAEKQGRKILVEVKSFLGRSFVNDLEQAVGQYIVYRDILVEKELDFKLYLAITKGT